MSSIETTELKLKTTPTGGVDASHSPYYRRLLSAGYKGFLQGTIGGASLYGTFGLAIGGLVAAPIIAFTPVGWAALALVPAMAGLGVVKGASTFGQIGSMAAITAESSDLSEQRRYLLDRYYDLPEGPEGDHEAEAIKKELLRAHETSAETPPFFHWKTVAVCAVIGAGLVLATAGLFSAGILSASAINGLIGLKAGAAITGMGGLSTLIAAGTALGALTGATIGIDRYYIRKWFDRTQDVVHSSSHRESALIERAQQVERIKAPSKADEKTKAQMLSEPLGFSSETPADKPTQSISQARRDGLIAIQKAMELPAV